MRTQTDTWKTQNDIPRTKEDIRQTGNDTRQTQNDTTRTQIDTRRTQIDAWKTQIDLSRTENDSLKTENDSSRTLEDQSNTTIPIFTADPAQRTTDDDFPDMDLFQMILESVLHKNIKHKRYIENGISKPLGSKREIGKAQMIEKSIHSFFPLPGFNEQKNKLIACRMIHTLRHEFLNKYQFLTSYISVGLACL